jgi:hypothetical protein
MKHAMTVFLYMRKTDSFDQNSLKYTTTWVPDLWTFKTADTENRIFVSEQCVEVESPSDFDPVPKQVAALEAEKRAAMSAYQEKVAEINDKLSKLQALEFAP